MSLMKSKFNFKKEHNKIHILPPCNHFNEEHSNSFIYS